VKGANLNPYSEMLDRLERRILTQGIANDDPALPAIGELLVRTGTLPAVAGILTDPRQPEPARMRALARAMQALRSVRVAA
jgi:hypothetical protein